MKLKEIMTSQVAFVEENASLEEAARMMKDYNIGSVPVCANNKVVGIITDRDIVLRGLAEGKNLKETNVRQVMTSNPVLGKPDMDTKDAARIMGERQIRRLPVTDGNTLVGMVSLGDFAVEASEELAVHDTLKEISEPCCPNV